MARLLRTCAVSCIALLLLIGGCDNVGRAFDPNVDPGGGTPAPAAPATIQVPPAGGDLRDGRPLVRATYPKAGGWPTSTPVVVEFSESVNTTSIAPTTTGGSDGKVFVRVKGTTQVLPANYDFLAGNRLLVIRPTPALTNQGSPSYEVVMIPGARDADGVRFAGTAEEILAEFTVDAPTDEVDGKILAVFPRDNQRDIARETGYVAVFTRQANAASITATTFALAANGSAIAGAFDLPLSLLGVDDARVVTFTPTSALPAATTCQLSVTAGITFGTAGTLTFGNRTPFARFTTSGVPAPTGVTVGNAATGFPDKVNRGNLLNLQIDVDVPAGAGIGDRVIARIYGGDKSTAATNDVAFVERTAGLATAGAQTVRIDFSTTLGTVDRPKLDDGSVILIAQLQRGVAHSAIVLGSNTARFDMTLPTITRFGPPGSATGTDIVTDQEALSLFGTASEALGEAVLTDGTTTATLFGASNDGRFQMRPLSLGRRTAPLGYSLTVTDLAGNIAAAPVTGNIIQRGVYTGAVAGTLTVVAYDDTTLLPVAGATVVVDPLVPTVPATGQLTATTDATGTATFTGLTDPTHTITLIATGYNLTTLYSTAAAFASLPLHPRATSTATLRGTASLQLAPSTTVVVGSNLFDDPTLLTVSTTSTSPGTIPPTPILANRPQVLTALGGTFEPTAVPSFSSVACNLLGSTLALATPPAAPALPGTDATRTLTLLPQAGALIGSLGTLVSEDWAAATGLDTANLVGSKPIVRFTLSLLGFPGQSAFGIGFATAGAGAVFTANGSWSQTLFAGLAPFISGQWVVVEARDTGGRLSRYRAVLNVVSGNPTDRMNPQAIPVIGGTSPVATAPAITVDDVLDPTALTGGLALYEVIAQDPSGRQWTLMLEDADAATGTEALQFPDLTNAGASGLALGSWSMRASARTFIPVSSTAGNIVLGEARRQEFGFSRSATATFVVQ